VAAPATPPITAPAPAFPESEPIAAPAPAPMRPPETARSLVVVPHALSANATVIAVLAAKVFIIDIFPLPFWGRDFKREDVEIVPAFSLAEQSLRWRLSI
jgi:hypothetical protein